MFPYLFTGEFAIHNQIQRSTFCLNLLTVISVDWFWKIISIPFHIAVVQKDLNQNLACIELFSANAMDVFINTFQKLGEFLLRPWRQGQPLHTGPPLVMVSMVTPLLALVKTLLIELLNSGKYQFKDARLMKSLMVLHTVMCTAPMTGQLSSLAHKVCGKTF